ncbi:MAG TPA: 30S ribosomal protein S3 [Candidatus Cloacimonetes bacterium]|nr:30S ribosomal protein S3 [Candidatus Cloacimonadota bacterium]HEX37881.1 30S ribosomal protein S3 [Candidatus Cloacimonadota bacterium]
MGQKTNPIGFRIGFNKDWESVWFANTRKEYVKTFYEDLKIKDYLEKRLSDAMISKIEINRKSDKITVIIHTARPGIVIGRKGAEIEKIKQELITLLEMNAQNDYAKLAIDVQEVKKPELDARLVGMDIARQIENRISYRRAMKRAIERTMAAGAEGIKIKTSGRLHGAEIARSEEYKSGRTPLHTLRADIDYAISEAHTRYGIIGIKVWICRGELMQKEHQQR